MESDQIRQRLKAAHIPQHSPPVTVTPTVAEVLQTLAVDAVCSVSLDGYGVELRELVYE
jgi:hypothetical protein